MIRDVAYAGFWRRACGALFDFVILLLPSQAAHAISVTMVGEREGALAGNLIFLPISLAYTVIGNGLGGTWGKRWAGMQVVDAAGDAPGMQRALVRAALPYSLSMLMTLVPFPEAGSTTELNAVIWLYLAAGLLTALDYLWMLWDSRKQTLHDKMAGTFVAVA
ncbi:MAG: RDD family protein [Thermomicrobiales bacterium]